MAARILPKSAPLYTVFVISSGETIVTSLTLDEARKRCRLWNKTAQHQEWATWREESAEAFAHR